MLVLPFFLYLPGIFGLVPFPDGDASYSDLLLTHFPYVLFLKNSIIQNLSIPLWTNLIYSGFPFTANPLSGLWYLPGWTALLFPLPAGIHIVLGLHSVLASWGLYKFLRSQKISRQAALFGGIAFGLLPKFNLHYGAGHVTLLYSIAWTPWLFLVSNSDRRGWKTGLIAGLIFLADPRWAVLVGVLWLVYDVAHRHLKSLERLKFYSQAALFAFMIASPLIFPLLEFVSFSTRSTLSTSDNLIFSLPPAKLLGLIIPTSGGNLEWFLYPGGVILVLIVIALIGNKIRKKTQFWLLGAGVSLIFSMGSFIPGSSFLNNIPLISLLRVPPRVLLITGFCLIMTAAKSIDIIINGHISKNKIRPAVFGTLIFAILFGLIMYSTLSQTKLKAIWGLIFIAISSVILFIPWKKTDGGWGWVLMAMMSIDMIGAGQLNIQYKELDGLLREKNNVIADLTKDKDRFRIYSPSYSIPQYFAELHKLELADGVDPMQLTSYANYMEEATGVVSDNYSVTIPPFATGNPEIDNSGSVPNPHLLGILNVKYLTSEYTINAEGINLIGKFSDVYLYENMDFHPRVWIQEEKSPSTKLAEEKKTMAEIISWEPNRIIIRSQGPGTLMLSEINYPGWRVFIDGEKGDIKTAFELIRSVQIGGGEHTIMFVYRPVLLYIGFSLAFAGWIYCAWLYIREK